MGTCAVLYTFGSDSFICGSDKRNGKYSWTDGDYSVFFMLLQSTLDDVCAPLLFGYKRRVSYLSDIICYRRGSYDWLCDIPVCVEKG